MLKSRLIAMLEHSIQWDGVVAVGNIVSPELSGTVLAVVNLPYDSVLNPEVTTDKLTIIGI